MKKKKKKRPRDEPTQPSNSSIFLWRGIIWLSAFLSLLVAVYITYQSSPKSRYHQCHAPLANNFTADYDLMIKERNAALKSYRYKFSEIDRRSDLSLEEFRAVYDGKWPVLLSGVVSKWPAANWTSTDLIAKYGSQRVSIKAVDKDLDAAISRLLQFQLPTGDHLTPLEQNHQGSLSDAVSLTLTLERFHRQTFRTGRPTQWSYVEDELFIPMRPELKAQLWDSPYLREDFFQLFPKSVRPWDAMLLWGTAFSRSSLHIDPYNWTGTNAVLSGRKRWKMFPPGQDHLLFVTENQMSGFPLNCFKYNSHLDAFNPEDWKLLEKAKSFEFDQLPGELLIIPPGWFHQAFNVEETLAVSGQLMNRNNFRIILEEILKTGVIHRSDLPQNIDLLNLESQVQTIMSLLPQDVLDRGKAVTENIIHEMQQPNSNFENYL